MRAFFYFTAISFLLLACNKDKFTTAPQLKFEEFTYNVADNTVSYANAPKAIFKITDKEGDIGYIPNKDTSMIYIFNPVGNKLDSTLLFPDISTQAGKNFEADIEINLFSVLLGNDSMGFRPRPFVDTLRFEVYVKDFAGNKSNVETTGPLIFTTL